MIGYADPLLVTEEAGFLFNQEFSRCFKSVCGV